MKIGIDIDETVTRTKETFQKNLKKYKKAHKLKQFSEEKQLSDEEFFKFQNEYGYELYYKIKEKKGASKTIKKWIEEGNEIYFVTARSKKDCEKVEEYTKEYFKQLGISYKKIIFQSSNKYEDTKNLKLDVFIDDRESVLDDFPKNQITLLRMVPNSNIYSKHTKITSWKEADKIIQNII